MEEIGPKNRNILDEKDAENYKEKYPRLKQAVTSPLGATSIRAWELETNGQLILDLSGKLLHERSVYLT